jgi:hypothetical protein
VNSKLLIPCVLGMLAHATTASERTSTTSGADTDPKIDYSDGQQETLNLPPNTYSLSALLCFRHLSRSYYSEAADKLQRYRHTVIKCIVYACFLGGTAHLLFKALR